VEISVTSPFPFEALPRVWRWIEQFRSKVSDDFGPTSLEEFMTVMRAKWDRQTTWAVSVDGELGGFIEFERLSPWLGTAHCMFKTEFQGKGVSLKALRIAFTEMFDTGIGKLAFYTFAGNLAIGSLVCNLGGKREGTLTAQTLVDGQPTDILVYGLTKENFNGKFDTRGAGSGRVDLRVVSIGPTENDHHAEQHDADVHSDGAGGRQPAPELVDSATH